MDVNKLRYCFFIFIVHFYAVSVVTFLSYLLKIRQGMQKTEIVVFVPNKRKDDRVIVRHASEPL